MPRDSAGSLQDAAQNYSVDPGNSGYLRIDGDYNSDFSYSYLGYTPPVPEPGTAPLWLLGAGVLGFVARARKNRR